MKMIKNFLKKKKGFTLIELLIVIGILGVLAVAVILALNPAEAQRKARDTKRAKDAATLQAIMEQYLGDSPTIPAGSCLINGSGGCVSTTGTQACNGGWLGGAGVNLCTYASTVPIDPINTTTAANGYNNDQTCNTAPATVSVVPNYRVGVLNGEYEVDVIQESLSNCAKAVNDAGTSSSLYEIGTNTSIAGM